MNDVWWLEKRPPANKAKLHCMDSVPDSGKWLTHGHRICSKTDTACTQSKMGVGRTRMVYTVGVGIRWCTLSV